MYRRSGMRGGESETAMKSAGTTVYYQDSSRGSAQASEPAGGRDRGGRKERRMTEVGNWWGWQGRRQRKQLSGVRRQEMEGLRGVRGRDRADGTSDRMRWNLSVSLFAPPRSHSSKCHRFLPSWFCVCDARPCRAVMGNPLIESLWYFSHVYLIIARSDASDEAKADPCLTVRSCHALDPLQEELFGKFCGAIARLMDAEGFFAI